VTAFLLLAFSLYSQEKIYTLDTDAFRDNSNETVRDASGSPVTGIVRSYHANANIKLEAPYKDGKRDGITRLYNRNGNLYSEIPYKEGLEEGVSKIYYRSGELMAEYTHKKGKMEGSVKYYFESGAAEYEGFYKNDKLDGLHRRYYKNGNISEEIYYKDGSAESAFCMTSDGGRTGFTAEQITALNSGGRISCE
jgi:antitoxin component YwqK of YwqJK toxin-antitoxin module